MTDAKIGPNGPIAADMLKAICSAGERCSCADKNYQWYGTDCKISIAHVNAIALRSTAPQALAAAPAVGGEARKWIIDLIHSEYDPKPSYYKPGDDWNDGTDEIAKRIAERYAAPPEQPDAPSDPWHADFQARARALHAQPAAAPVTDAIFDLCVMIVEEECYLDHQVSNDPLFKAGWAIKDRIRCAQRNPDPASDKRTLKETKT